MVEALILLNTTTGVMEKVHEKLERIEEVRRSALVTGPYDLFALVEIEEMGELRDSLVEKIRNIEGVEETTTNLIIS